MTGVGGTGAAMTSVGTAELLSSGSGSLVAEVRPASFSIGSVAEAGTLTTNVNAAVAPAGSVAMSQVMIPPAPTAGVAQENKGPLF